MRLTSCNFSMRRSTKIVTKETMTPTWCARFGFGGKSKQTRKVGSHFAHCIRPVTSVLFYSKLQTCR